MINIARFKEYPWLVFKFQIKIQISRSFLFDFFYFTTISTVAIQPKRTLFHLVETAIELAQIRLQNYSVIIKNLGQINTKILFK